MLLKVVRRINHSFVGYLFLLLAFACLGLFVAALAFGSPWAVVSGAALAGSLVAAVVGFRIGASADNASKPLRQDTIDQYCLNYRGGRGRRLQRVS
jgi:hypothetical protein